MSPDEKQQVARLNEKLKRTIDIHLVVTGDARSQTLEAFGRELVENAPGLRLIIEKEDAGAVIPGLHIASSMIYHAVPHGMELPPFIDMLASVSEQTGRKSRAGSIQDPEIPAMLKLYVSSTCTFCPAMVRKLTPLVLQDARLRLTIIDGVLFPEMAATDYVRSVPTLIMDDQFRWTGTVDLDELLNAVQRRDPAQLSAGTLASMISDGNAYRLADMMLERDCIFPGFFDLLTHPAFSTRLGAMAAAEEIAERQKHLAAQMAVSLAERFERQTDTVKGDLLYIMGMAGDNRVIGFLKEIAAGAYPDDIKEDARDAIGEIRSR